MSGTTTTVTSTPTEETEALAVVDPDAPSLLDDAAEEIKTGEDGTRIKPEGLPDAFWDMAKGEVRQDALIKSWRDMRTQVARGLPQAPANPEAYTPPKAEGLPEDFIGGEKDVLWPEIRKAAHAAGVSQAQLDAIATPFLAAAAKAAADRKAAEPDPAALRAEREAEFNKLGPNGRALVRDVGGWLAGLESRGIISPEEHRDLRALGTANGVRGLAKLREMAGEKPIPLEAVATEGASQRDLERQLMAARQAGDQAGVERALRQLGDLEKRGMLVL